MRQSLTAALFIVMMAMTVPAQAQLRSADTSMNNTARLYDTGQSGLSLNRFFSPEHFHTHLVKLPQSAFLGTFVPKHRTNCKKPLYGLFNIKTILNICSDHRSGGFRPHGNLFINEGVHLLFDDIGGFTN